MICKEILKTKIEMSKKQVKNSILVAKGYRVYKTAIKISLFAVKKKH